MTKHEDYYSLINTARWRHLRAQRLKADRYLCQRCLARGRLRAATQVHHITPVESAHSIDSMARLCYDFNNTTSLCETCHSEVHTERRKNKVKKEELNNFAKRFLDEDEEKKRF